jgi:hypothetical protein
VAITYVNGDASTSDNVDTVAGVSFTGLGHAAGDYCAGIWALLIDPTPALDGRFTEIDNDIDQNLNAILFEIASMSGSESGTVSMTTTGTNAINRMSAGIVIYRGVGSRGTIVNFTEGGTADDVHPVANNLSITPTADNAMILLVYSERSSTGNTVGTLAPPTHNGTSTQATIRQERGTGGSGGTYIQLAEFLLGSGTAGVAQTFTQWDATPDTLIASNAEMWLIPLYPVAAVTGSAVAAFGFTGASNGVGRALGAAVASFGFTATIAGTRQVDGLATAAFEFASVASGVDRSLGLAVALLGFTGIAAGIDRSVGAAGAGFGFVATVAGIRDVPGAATAVFGFTGSAQGAAGTPPVTGTALASFGFTAAAQGQPRTSGVAVAAFGFTSTAAGSPRVVAAAVASFGFTGTGVGERSTAGVAQALFGFAAIIAGLPIPPVVYGTATAATGSAPASQASPGQTAAASPGVMPVPTATGG